MIKKTLEPIIAGLQKRLQSADSDEAEKANITAILTKYQNAAEQANKIITAGEDNFERIKKATQADQANEQERKITEQVEEGQRLIEENKGKVTEIEGKIAAQLKAKEATKDQKKITAATNAIEALNKQKKQIEDASKRF